MIRNFIYRILKDGCESQEKGCEFSNSLYIAYIWSKYQIASDIAVKRVHFRLHFSISCRAVLYYPVVECKSFRLRTILA